METLSIVPVDDIPKDIVDTPLTDLLAVYKVCKQLEDLCDKKEGIGLAAVQAGIPWKLFIVKGDGTGVLSKGRYGYFVNCTYEPVGDDLIDSVEGCLSLTSDDGKLRRFELKRHKTIRVKGKKLTFQKGKDLTVVDFDETMHWHQQSCVFAHEADHTFGVLISDKGKEVFLY